MRLAQVLGNLIGNSLKFTPTGSVWLRAESAGTDPQGRVRVRIEVRDTGVGIAREAQECLFQPFSGTRRPSVLRAGGAGLGLPLAQRLVQLMGGTLAVESAPGAGTSVRIELPLAPRSGGLADQAAGAADPSAPV
ncbi:MAG: hypothetical protein IPJ19_12500 [Planctomycetes bacterium]|nr:hypothetical protein [Planctomycetota bacterium]